MENESKYTRLLNTKFNEQQREPQNREIKILDHCSHFLANTYPISTQNDTRKYPKSEDNSHTKLAHKINISINEKQYNPKNQYVYLMNPTKRKYSTKSKSTARKHHLKII